LPGLMSMALIFMTLNLGISMLRRRRPAAAAVLPSSLAALKEGEYARGLATARCQRSVIRPR